MARSWRMFLVPVLATTVFVSCARPSDPAAIHPPAPHEEMMATEAETSPHDPIFEVGSPAPALLLPSLKEGEPVQLVERGRKTLLIVFASW